MATPTALFLLPRLLLAPTPAPPSSAGREGGGRGSSSALIPVHFGLNDVGGAGRQGRVVHVVLADAVSASTSSRPPAASVVVVLGMLLSSFLPVPGGRLPQGHLQHSLLVTWTGAVTSAGRGRRRSFRQSLLLIVDGWHGRVGPATVLQEEVGLIKVQGGRRRWEGGGRRPTLRQRMSCCRKDEIADLYAELD